MAPRIAVLIPCHNEELTIGEVVRSFRKELPQAVIHVYDNNSSDRTAELAREAGAVVTRESRQGKGNVVQSMFRRVEADVYIMVDGDATYPAREVHRLLEPILNDTADMTIGSRLLEGTQSDFKALNRFGNRMYLFVLEKIFGVRLTDMLSGYRAFNRAFVTGMPLFGGGFETETEMTIRALQRRFRLIEIPVDLRARPTGSESKIRIVRDGIVILGSMLALFRDYKPLSFFGGIGLALIFAGLVPGMVVILEYVRTHTIARMPSAILAVGTVLAGLLSLLVGIILHVIAQRFRELDFHLQMLNEELRRAETRTRNDARSRDRIE